MYAGYPKRPATLFGLTFDKRFVNLHVHVITVVHEEGTLVLGVYTPTEKWT